VEGTRSGRLRRSCRHRGGDRPGRATTPRVQPRGDPGAAARPPCRGIQDRAGDRRQPQAMTALVPPRGPVLAGIRRRVHQRHLASPHSSSRVARARVVPLLSGRRGMAARRPARARFRPRTAGRAGGDRGHPARAGGCAGLAGPWRLPPPAGDYTTHDVLDDALAVIERAHAAAMIPVGLSHAGWVAIELRRRLGHSRIPASSCSTGCSSQLAGWYRGQQDAGAANWSQRSSRTHDGGAATGG
jgi:hypothetical protein